MNSPFEHLYYNKGKEIRLKFAEKCYKYFNVPQKYYDSIELFEKMHCITLILDDIQDNSIKRRGKKATHIIHGIPWTLGSALSEYMKILKYISDNFSKNIMKIFIDELNIGFDSQLKEIYHRDKNISLNYKNYKDIVNGKTLLFLKV